MYIKDGQIYTPDQVRAALPRMSIPDGADLSSLGYEQIINQAAPSYDPITQVAERGDPELVDGQWTRGWKIRSLNQSEIDALFAEKMAAIQAGKVRAMDGGFVHAGTLYDSDANARLAYLELSVKLGQDATYTTPWKASTGVWVTMTAALFAALQTTYEAHIAACFAWQAAREQELAAAYALEDAAAMIAVAETM